MWQICSVRLKKLRRAPTGNERYGKKKIETCVEFQHLWTNEKKMEWSYEPRGDLLFLVVFKELGQFRASGKCLLRQFILGLRKKESNFEKKVGIITKLVRSLLENVTVKLYLKFQAFKVLRAELAYPNNSTLPRIGQGNLYFFSPIY